MVQVFEKSPGIFLVKTLKKDMMVCSVKIKHPQSEMHVLSGVYTANLFTDLDFYLGQTLSLYEAKYLGQIFSQTFYFIEGQYLTQIKFQIV